jgi:hypothetical protein
MPANLSLAVEFLGFVVAVSLVVFGVWKLDVRFLAAGVMLAGLVWVWVACSSADESIRHELLMLHLRPVDATTGETVAGAVVEAIESPESAPRQIYRLPATTGRSSEEKAPTDLAVLLVVELHLTGSLVEQRRQPQAHIEAVEQRLQITAPRYRPWNGTLTELLPSGWPTTPLSDMPITVELRRD